VTNVFLEECSKYFKRPITNTEYYLVLGYHDIPKIKCYSGLRKSEYQRQLVLFGYFRFARY
jgi:hypothetical protein